MSSSSDTVAGIKLRADRPTTVALAELGEWVIWQFPQRHKRGYRGAVKPPLAEHAWLPAIVNADRGRVQIYAHLGADFATPETAVAYFAKNSGG